MRKMAVWILMLTILPLLGHTQGCVQSQVVSQVEGSLPQEKLINYNDSFDKFREELWERVGFTWTPAQLAKLKIADTSVENGELRITTKRGGFSKGGLASKYKLRGDFDVQVDCRIDFLEGPQDIDQMLAFAVFEKGVSMQKSRLISISLIKKEDGKQNGIFSSYREKGKYHPGKWVKTGDFSGALRIVRGGSKITTLYSRQGKPKWVKMNTFPSTGYDATVAFALQNFVVIRQTIAASSTVTAIFDNFIINAASEIIEEEI